MAAAQRRRLQASRAVAMVGNVALVMVALLLATIAPAATGARTCGATGPYVGFKGPLSTLEHDVGGNVEIVDDCTAMVTMASYDGAAPAAYWWCSASTARKDMRAGFRANNAQLTTALNGLQTVTVQLDGKLEWSDCPVLGVWCEMFQADFGHVELAAANGSAVPAAPAANRTATLPAGMVDNLDNCLELIPGKLNVYWKLDNKTGPSSVTMTLQGAISDGSWMAFGFSDPSKPEASMIGGDVVVAGLVKGQGFAVDYYLSKRDQCNYAGGQNEGVCPDAGYLKQPSDNNAKMTAFSSISGVVSVTFTRTLVTPSPYDHPWPAGKDAAPALFATGPLSEQSTLQQQVVLYHGLTRSDASFRMTLGASGNKCPTPLQSDVVVNKTQGGVVGTIFGRTTFDVTTGPNPNYPNPPAWGLSYHIDGLETPVLRVYRGVEYTFNIMAGDQHPLYLTSDITGGNSNAAEKIIAGGEEDFGTPEAPRVLKWMPDGTTPAGLFYQCFVHQKLGWKVEVVDATDTSACSKTHPYVGFKGKLSQLEHGVAGEVEVVDDCTFTVAGFKYDGQAPAAYFYGGKEDKDSAYKAGARLSPHLVQGYDGNEELITVRLPAATSWDTVGAISVWCEQFNANFGSIALKAGPDAAAANGTAACIVPTDTGKATYDSCVDLPGSVAGLRFAYTLSKAASGNALVKGALQTSALDGWVGLGFAQSPGVMVGADAVIMRQTPKGIEASHYHLAARTVQGVMPPSKLPFKLLSAAATTTSRRKLYATTAATATFEVELPMAYATVLTQPLPFIYSAGPTDPATGNLQPHRLQDAKGTSLVLGRKMSGGTAVSTGGGGNIPRLRKVHGFLMGIGWGVLVPLGIVSAHSFKEYDPLWFYVHVACQVTGFLLGTAGFGIGLHLGFKSKGITYKSHRIVGIVAFGLSVLQVLLGLVRPDKASRLRRGWEIAHHWTGRTATLLAIINIYRGFDILDGLGTSIKGWKIALSVVLGAIIAVGLLKSWANYLALPPPATTPHSKHPLVMKKAADGSGSSSDEAAA